MGDVVYPCIVTRLDLPPDRLLEKAIGQMEDVIIIGYDKDGMEYFASSLADGAETLWRLERAKYRLLDMVEKMHGKNASR